MDMEMKESVKSTFGIKNVPFLLIVDKVITNSAKCISENRLSTAYDHIIPYPGTE
jgi:hypothetical protein